MKFEAQLTYVTGYLRAGRLVGELSPEDYEIWQTLPANQQQEMLWDAGNVVLTDYSVEDAGDYYDLSWSNHEDT